MTNVEMTGYIEVDEKHLEQAKRMVEEALFNLPFETYIEFNE
jgi:hypothetical protein